MSELRAGVGRVTITPPVGMYLVGMERSEGSHGLRDDLYATALALSTGGEEAVIISCDVLVFHPEFVERVRQDAAEQTSVPPENIMFCATHCHSGPVTYALPDSRPMYRAYVDNLAFLLSGVIRMAHDRLEPAMVGFDRGHARIGINRRLTRPDGVTVIAANPDGPVDPEVGVMRVDTTEGRPLCVVVNYACHPVVLGNGSNVISADWPGAMRRVAEQVTGAKCLFIQGAGADVNPLPGQPSDCEDVLERLGTEIGGEVLSVWAGIEPERTKELVATSDKVLIPLLPPSAYEEKLPDFVELADAVDEFGWDELQAWMRDRAPWIPQIVGEGDARRAVMELQAIRVGGTAVVSAAGEIFVKTGLAVKRRSPFPNTIFAGYTNGLVCYIPLPEDYPRGGYEVNEVYLSCRLPSPPAPDAAELVEEEALRLLEVVEG